MYLYIYLYTRVDPCIECTRSTLALGQVLLSFVVSEDLLSVCGRVQCRLTRSGTLSLLSARASSCRFLCLVFSCLASSGLTSSFLLLSCPVSSCLASSCLLLACLTSGVANRHSFEWYRCFLLFASRLFGDSLRPAVLHSSVRCRCLLLFASWAGRGQYKPLGAPSP